MIVALGGCMSQEEGVVKTIQDKYKWLNIVFGTHNIYKFPELLYTYISLIDEETVVDVWDIDGNIVEGLPSVRRYDFKAFVNIMYGCNNFCTYCIVPYVRGREVSRPPEDILAEIDSLSEKNVREITLLGQNVNSYNGHLTALDKKTDFPTLLRLIARQADKTDSIKWIRFMSSHPKDMSDALIQTIASEKRVCKLVHLPVQHGSNAVLKRMNRVYTVEHYKERVKRLKETVPGIALSTDLLMGFPGETEDDVKATLELMQEIEFDAAFMYHYNPREGTRAYNFPDRIPDAERINRLQQVITLQQSITEQKMLKRIGSNVTMLVESQSRNNPDELFGHTEQGEMAVLAQKCDPQHIGHFMQVQLQSVKGKTFRAIPTV